MMIKINWRQVIYWGGLHFVAFFILYGFAWITALGAFERTPTLVENIIVFLGSALGFPLFIPLAEYFGRGIGVIAGLLLNSIFWGLVLAVINFFLAAL